LQVAVADRGVGDWEGGIKEGRGEQK